MCPKGSFWEHRSNKMCILFYSVWPACHCDAEGATCSDTVTQPCVSTCSSPYAQDNCTSQLNAYTLIDTQDVCICPGGQVLFNGACIIRTDCPCIDTNGYAHQVCNFYQGSIHSHALLPTVWNSLYYVLCMHDRLNRIYNYATCEPLTELTTRGLLLSLSKYSFELYFSA